MTLSWQQRAAALLTVIVATGGAVGSVPSVADAAGAPAHHARAKAPYVSTLKIDKSEAMVDQPIVLSGTVKPAVRGTVVKLQKKLEGSNAWKDEKELRTNAAGKFTYRDKPTTAGKRQYRVVVPETAKRGKDISKPVALLLYRWLDLTRVKVRSISHTYAKSAVSINGTDYSRALSGSTDYYDKGMVDWNFDRRCTSVKARFGNGDDSDDTATASVELVVDGEAVYTRSFLLTESQYQVIDVTGAFRVGFEWTSSNSAGTETDQSGAQATMASPMVRCSF